MTGWGRAVKDEKSKMVQTRQEKHSGVQNISRVSAVWADEKQEEVFNSCGWPVEQKEVMGGKTCTIRVNIYEGRSWISGRRRCRWAEGKDVESYYNWWLT